MTESTNSTLTAEALALSREIAIDLTLPAVRITDLCDRAAALAADLAALANRAEGVARDLRGQSVNLDETICKLADALGNEEDNR